MPTIFSITFTPLANLLSLCCIQNTTHFILQANASRNDFSCWCTDNILNPDYKTENVKYLAVYYIINTSLVEKAHYHECVQQYYKAI